jgi:hypothetical protein
MMKRRQFNLLTLGIGATVLGGGLSGCGTSLKSTALTPDRLQAGIRLQRSLPDNLPSGTQVLPQEQLVLVPTESAAGLLMPVPFVAEAIASTFDKAEATAAAQRLATVDPFAAARLAWQGSPLVSESDAALVLRPFAFLQACADDQYRVALVYQLNQGEWVARYTVHLRTTYGENDFHRVTPSVLQSLNREISEGSAVLRTLVERGARGELRPSGIRVDVGSLHLVGGRSGGWMSPTLIVVRDADLIEESADHILVRLSGNPSMPASGGGLFFGVHQLRKDQLHTFRSR